MNRFCVSALSLLILAPALNGCVSVRTNHGYVLERGETELTAKEGVDTKESVLAKYGEPSLIGTFDPDAWYYLNSRDAARAFFKPKVKDRTVVAFRFDDEGYVSKVEEIGYEEGMDVNLVNRKTPTRGKELSFWEQLLGNVGQLPGAGQGQNGPQ